MFTVDLLNLETEEVTTYQLAKAISRIGSHQDCDLSLSELDGCGYDIIVSKDLGSNFRCQQVYYDADFSGEAFNEVYENSAKFDLGSYKLTITSIDTDLKINREEELDQAGYRLLKKALGNELVSLPALKVVEPREYLFSFGMDQQVEVGRGEQADMMLAESDISASHARFSYSDSQYWVEDLGSTNGTFINGKQVSGKMSFDVNDCVQLGASTIVVGVFAEQLPVVDPDDLSFINTEESASIKFEEEEGQDSSDVLVANPPEDSAEPDSDQSLEDIAESDQAADSLTKVEELESDSLDQVDEVRATAPVVMAESFPILISTSKLARPAKLVLRLDKPVVIGRDPTSDFWLGAPFVSRRHCQVTYLGNNQVEVLDTSSNGTGYSRGTIASGSGYLCNMEPEVLHFGSGLAVAICFDQESEQAFVENDGKVDTFVANEFKADQSESGFDPESSDSNSATFKPLRKPLSSGEEVEQSTRLVKNKAVFLILSLVVLFIFIVLIKIILIFL